ncbi:12318_t:CDS:2 [Entrophospora sp. SA101]|nr:12318_t:CDS:2 [Entrophospora sp. SA101]
MSKPSIHFCTKYTIDKMRNSGQTPTLTELQQAILSEAKYNSNWSAAVILFEDFDRIVWERLTRLLDKNNDKTTGQSNKQTLKEIWLQTSIALQPLSITELKYVRQVYQIMVRYAPTIKDVSYYYLHLLKNHIETPILDAEVVNHCLNSLIYHISLSKDTDYLTRGLDLVKIALGRNMGTDKNNVLQSVSKGILKFNGVRITKNGKNIEKERPNDNNFVKIRPRKKSKNRKFGKNGTVDGGGGSSDVDNNIHNIHKNNNTHNIHKNKNNTHNVIVSGGSGGGDKLGKNGVILNKKIKSLNIYCWDHLPINSEDEKNAENDEWNKKEYPPNCQQIQQEQDNSENYKFDELESETEFIIDGHKKTKNNQ